MHFPNLKWLTRKFEKRSSGSNFLFVYINQTQTYEKKQTAASFAQPKQVENFTAYEIDDPFAAHFYDSAICFC
jgi:hypothetical protein